MSGSGECLNPASQRATIQRRPGRLIAEGIGTAREQIARSAAAELGQHAFEISNRQRSDCSSVSRHVSGL